MKKLLVLLIVALMFVGCTTDVGDREEPQKIVANGKKYEVCVIEGCEYLVHYYGNGGLMAHKGNCKNCKK